MPSRRSRRFHQAGLIADRHGELRRDGHPDVLLGQRILKVYIDRHGLQVQVLVILDHLPDRKAGAAVDTVGAALPCFPVDHQNLIRRATAIAGDENHISSKKRATTTRMAGR